jgi:hypothetical protein
VRSPPRRSAQVSLIATATAAAVAVPALANSAPFLNRLTKIRGLASMVPANGPAKGDQNPYGVAVVSRSTGHGLYFVDDNGSGPAANSLQILH